MCVQPAYMPAYGKWMNSLIVFPFGIVISVNGLDGLSELQTHN